MMTNPYYWPQLVACLYTPGAPIPSPSLAEPTPKRQFRIAIPNSVDGIRFQLFSDIPFCTCHEGPELSFVSFKRGCNTVISITSVEIPTVFPDLAS